MQTQFRIEGKLAACASNDKTRPALCNVELTRGGVDTVEGNSGAFLCATDGHVLALREVVGDFAKSSELIPADVVDNAKEHEVRRNNGAWECRTITKLNVPDSAFVAYPVVNNDTCGPFPDVTQVLPESIEGYQTLSFNVANLVKLAKAIGTSKVSGQITLYVKPGYEKDGTYKPTCPKPADSAILVEGLHGVGLLMPLRGDGDGSEYSSMRRRFVDAREANNRKE